MEVDIEMVRRCPICGEDDVDPLTEHLQNHSKQSLIDVLLAQQQQICRDSPIPVIAQSQAGGSVVNERLTQANVFFEFQQSPLANPKDKGEDKSLKNLKSKTELPGASTSGQIRKNLLPQSTVQSVVDSVATNSITTVKEKKTSGSRQSPLIKTEANYLHNSTFDQPKGRPTFMLVDHSSPSKPGPSRRRISNEDSQPVLNAAVSDSPNTSIIQYIIDESGQITDAPQEEPDSWILADGRTIPVYSSLTQIPQASGGSVSPCTMTVDILAKAAKKGTAPLIISERLNQVQLDLTTDEEIPPRGEISEYEESNASSILSEDSNLKPNASGLFADRRSPAPAIHEPTIVLSRKKKPSKPQQYSCQDCPQVQVFGSLFELAEHKFEVHQNKSMHLGSSSVSTKLLETDVKVPEPEHILPEKIRRQSQDEDDDLLSQKQVEKKVLTSTTMSSQGSKKEYFCVYCNFTASKKTSMADHMDVEHPGQPRTPTMFECNFCGKIFQARTNLRKHLLIHKERKYNCPTCTKGFTSNFKLIEHMRVHTKNYPFKCSVCEKPYRTLSLLNHHTKMIHLPEGERPPKRKLEFYCSTCHRVLHSKRSYLNHMQVHQEKPMKCTFCSEIFTRNSVLVRHIRISHDPHYESKESKDCPVCHKKLHPNSMIKHMRIHSNEKPYSCNVCGKFFRTYANLNSHSWSHTNNEKPHKCRLCSKSYLFKKNLENHMIVHKKTTWFTCNECGVKFSHKVNMKRHLEEHFKEKSHVCKTCNKAFQRHYYLIEHERIHSGVKPFQCTICGKASTTKSNHRAHLKIHDARETGNQEG